MPIWIYGIVSADGGFIPTSTTEKGAKRHATINGYTSVYKMHQVSWDVARVAYKNSLDIWVNENY